MTKNEIQLLYQYDRWANARVLRAVSSLSSEHFTRKLGGSFPSVRDTLVHMLSGEWIWLAYWKEPFHKPGFLPDLEARRKIRFNPEAFPNVASLKLKWKEVEDEIAEFVNHLTDESLQKMLPFRTGTIKLTHLMQHVANHSTYHRGQIALMMRQLSAAPLATDFHVFLLERDRDAGSAG
jgi:uncharacterized damage-inducible protein DinB